MTANPSDKTLYLQHIILPQVRKLSISTAHLEPPNVGAFRVNLIEIDKAAELLQKLHIANTAMLVGQYLSLLIDLAFANIEDANLVRLVRQDPIQILDGRLQAVGHKDRRRRVGRLLQAIHSDRRRQRRVVQLKKYKTKEKKRKTTSKQSATLKRNSKEQSKL